MIPTIRRTGGYVSNEEMFIENYLPFLDEPYRDLFRLQMTIIGKLNERIRHDQPLVEFAPDGYEIANEIRFTVNEDGSVTEVVMYDELTPKTTTPYTGDNHSDFAAFALMGASLIIFLVLIIGRKKKDDNEPEDHSAYCPDFIEIDED